MSYYTQPIITHFNEIAPGDTVNVPAKTFDSTHSLPAMSWAAERAPLYDTSGLTDPSNAIYISPTGDDNASGNFAGTSGDPFKTVGKARSFIDNTVKADTWILCLEGNYRQKWGTTFSDQNTHVKGVKAASGAKVWFDGSDFLTGGSWSHSGDVWTWSGSFTTAIAAAAQQVFLDGVPLIKTTNSSPGLGAFYTSGTTLKIGSTVDPSTKVIEFSNRNSPVATIKKNGFYIGYVGFRRFSESSGNVLALSAQNQQLDHVVLAYTSGSAFLLNTSASKSLSLTEVVVTHGAGKAWTDDNSTDMTVAGMRVWGTNWRHDHNTAPSNSASLGGVKHWKSKRFRGSDILFGWNVSNGEWFDGSDVGNPSADNRAVRATYWFNGGYGQTTEVSTTRELADVLCVGNGWMGFGNVDGTRFSGVNESKLYACTSLDNVGAAVGNYEDGREYGGTAANYRKLSPSVGGDNIDCEQQGAVMCRTQRTGANGVKTGTKPPFYSFCQTGAATIAGQTESSAKGFVQTVPIATADMYATHGKNVYLDTTGTTNIATVAAPGAGANWTISYDSSGKVVATPHNNPTATAKKTLAQMQALGLDAGSVAVTTSGKSIGDYFPDAGDTGDPGEPADPNSVYTWWALTNIPGTSTAIPTYTPPDWVCDALKVSRGSTVVAGCHLAPIPVPIGTTATNTAPDVATIITPAAGDTISGSSVSVSGTGHDPEDNHSITVELRADGQPIGSGAFLSYDGSGDSFSGTFDSTKLSDGNHDLRIRVTDSAGLWLASTKHTVTVNNGSDSTGPTVASLTLSDGAVVKQPTVVSATVTDTSGVKSVIARVTDSAGNTYDFTMT